MAFLSTDPIDWELDEDGDVKIPLRYTSGLTGVAQAVRIAVQMVRGEWFADLGVGVPYFEREDGSVTRQEALLGGKFDAVRAREDFRREILAVPWVTAILLLDVVLDRPTRALTVKVQTRTAFGDTPIDTLVRDMEG